VGYSFALAPLPYCCLDLCTRGTRACQCRGKPN
jgi:hypothetical protein